uniref:Uncharacterized protein n=1 Tax=Agaricus bisporus virus 3 TaxID=1945748 RepID=A0A1Q1N6H7_9VIRU|nr:hypothetical protein [Agaricus bisporus virus 3]
MCIEFCWSGAIEFYCVVYQVVIYVGYFGKFSSLDSLSSEDTDDESKPDDDKTSVLLPPCQRQEELVVEVSNLNARSERSNGSGDSGIAESPVDVPEVPVSQVIKIMDMFEEVVSYELYDHVNSQGITVKRAGKGRKFTRFCHEGRVKRAHRDNEGKFVKWEYDDTVSYSGVDENLAIQVWEDV